MGQYEAKCTDSGVRHVGAHSVSLVGRRKSFHVRDLRAYLPEVPDG